MAKKIRDGVWRCTGGFTFSDGARKTVVRSDGLVPHDYPYEVMDGRERLFEDVTPPSAKKRSARRSETATAAPDEVRDAKVPADE